MLEELIDLEAWAKAQFEHCRQNFEELEDKEERIRARVAGYAFLYMINALHGDYRPFRHHLMGDYDEDWEKSTPPFHPLVWFPREPLKEPKE